MEPSIETSDSSLTPTLSKILASAEVEFAEAGFEGAGMKAIARRAGVSQGLVHYHFGSKEHLYGEVIRHRSREINDSRCALLSQINFESPDVLSQILEALFRPTLGAEGGGKAYARIFAGLIVAHSRDQALVEECYDPTAARFIDAMTRCGLDRPSASMTYQFALGVLASVISRDGRLERLMGREEPFDTDSLISALVSFTIGGATNIEKI